VGQPVSDLFSNQNLDLKTVFVGCPWASANQYILQKIRVTEIDRIPVLTTVRIRKCYLVPDGHDLSVADRG
jgi:hypothetical protein